MDLKEQYAQLPIGAGAVCEHNCPASVSAALGGYYVRYVQCRTLGPVREDPEGARRALLECRPAMGSEEIVLRIIREEGVEAYDGSVRYLEAARDAGLRRAVVSSSANTREVLVAAGIEGFFEARIYGVVAEREGLEGKPAPAAFLAGARALGVVPGQATVFEDALACVVGVDRAGQPEALREHGASIVVSDLSELLEDR